MPGVVGAPLQNKFTQAEVICRSKLFVSNIRSKITGLFYVQCLCLYCCRWINCQYRHCLLPALANLSETIGFSHEASNKNKMIIIIQSYSNFIVAFLNWSVSWIDMDMWIGWYQDSALKTSTRICVFQLLHLAPKVQLNIWNYLLYR